MVEIGDLIGASRTKLNLTQDQFGKRYNVSGPAIFKFEKGYVKPSLELWLRMAKDIDISEQEAVLMWARGKLPKKFQSFVSMEAQSGQKAKKKEKPKKSTNPDLLRKEIQADRTAPKGLKAFLKDEDMWTLYKPTAQELEVLREIFAPLGEGSKTSYREALRLIREFGEK
jgi:DNA-binding XRE family transcriptional regulator